MRIDRDRLKSLMAKERQKFVDERPKSKALFERASKSLLAGVPMNWMMKWAGAFPPLCGKPKALISTMSMVTATSISVWAIRAQ